MATEAQILRVGHAMVCSSVFGHFAHCLSVSLLGCGICHRMRSRRSHLLLHWHIHGLAIRSLDCFVSSSFHLTLYSLLALHGGHPRLRCRPDSALHYME